MHWWEIYQRCKEFKVGDAVNIIERIRSGDGKRSFTQIIPGTVIARYLYFLMIRTEKNTVFSFSYIDIVIFGTVVKEIKTGKRRYEGR